VGSEIFRTFPDLPWGPTSLLYNGYRAFPGGKEGTGDDADPLPLLVPWSRRGRAIPLPSYGPYGLYRASVPVQGCTLPFTLHRESNWQTSCLIVQCLNQICQIQMPLYAPRVIGGLDTPGSIKLWVTD